MSFIPCEITVTEQATRVLVEHVCVKYPNPCHLDRAPDVVIGEPYAKPRTYFRKAKAAGVAGT